MRHGPTAKSWSEMRQRCNNPNNDKWKYYGGRGIKVCDRWDSYAAFLEDMGERPAGKTLDRIRNSGNYEPGNCRWATPHEQAANKRNNRLFLIDGAMVHMSEAARRAGLKPATVWARLNYGWSVQQALSCGPLPLGAPGPNPKNITRKLDAAAKADILSSKEPARVMAQKYCVSRSLVAQVRSQEASNRAADRATQ